MQKLSGLFLFAVLISGAFSSSFAFAQIEPIAKNDLYSVNEDSILTIAPTGVLLNDTNIDSDMFAIIQTNVGFGTLTFNLDGSFTYKPNQNFDSIDSFTYFVTNGTHNSNNATVTLFVNPINDAPISLNDTTSTLENIPVSIPVLNNDSDVDGDLLTVNSITQGTNGTVTTNGTIMTYVPKTNFNGTDSFTYTVSDGINISNSAIVTVTVTSVDNEHDEEHDKVNICHKYKKPISVSKNAISAHLKHGDVLGACSNEHNDHNGKHNRITDKKILQNEIKTLKEEFKSHVKDLKNQYKDAEKNLKNQLKELKKDKKSYDDKHDD